MNFHGGDIYNLDKEVLDFSSNINPLGVPLGFKKMLADNIDSFTRYPDLQYMELKRAIAKYLEINSLEYIVAGNGAVEIIYKTVEALNIKRVYIAAPTFSEYRRAASSKGIEFEEIKAYSCLNGSIILEKLLNKLKPNSLYVICNPNNPTGTLTDIDTLSLIAEALEGMNSYLLIDEAFIEFCDLYPKCSFINRIKDHSNVIVIRAATKFFGIPGIRLGYGVSSNKGLIKRITNRLEPWNINTAAVLAGLSIFKDEDYILKSREWISNERLWLFNKLSSIKGLLVYPSKANFFLAKIEKETLNADQLKERMIKKGILIRTSEGFTHLSPYNIRIAVKDMEANKKLSTALKASIYKHKER